MNTAGRLAIEKSLSVTGSNGIPYDCSTKNALLRYMLVACELVSLIGTPDGISKVVSRIAHSPTTPPFSRVSMWLLT